MRWTLVLLLTAPALLGSGCIGEQPQSFPVPELQVGDVATYEEVDHGGRASLEVLSPITVPTADLGVARAFRLNVMEEGADPSSRESVTFYHAADGAPAIGWSGMLTLGAYLAADQNVPLSHLAFLAFHGFAGTTISTGDSTHVDPRWLGHWADGPCTLTAGNVYVVANERRVDLTCTEDRSPLTVTLSERHPIPVKVDGDRATFRLLAFTRPDPDGEVVDPPPVQHPLAKVAYTADGPAEPDATRYSLATAAREVREALPVRPAKRCLDERPSAVLAAATFVMYEDAPQWRLTWLSPDGACRAEVNQGRLDDPGTNDAATTGAGADLGDWLDADVLSLAGAYALWDGVIDEPLEGFQLELDPDGALDYHLSGPTRHLHVDAGAMRLRSMTFA